MRYRINNGANVGDCYVAMRKDTVSLTAGVQSCCSVLSSLCAFSRVPEYVSGR